MMSCVPPADNVFPIFEYTHFGPCSSIVGGFVYRGCAMPDFVDTYFYSDTCNNFVRTIQVTGGIASSPTDRTADVTSAGATLNQIGSFGQDARGELYILDLSDGDVYRIEPE
jgi:hypothetical protein